MRSQHISEIIRATPERVYEYAADPAHLQAWAAGLAESEVHAQGDHLVVQSPMGEVTVRFAPRNTFGVLDHEVRLPSGETVLNPVRVLPHPCGAEVVFTVRQLNLTDAEFERDCEMVAADLLRLRSRLER